MTNEAKAEAEVTHYEAKANVKIFKSDAKAKTKINCWKSRPHSKPTKNAMMF
jgi:hypothetical protein